MPGGPIDATNDAPEELVIGDAGIDFHAFIHELGDATALVDLDGAEVRFQMRREIDRHVLINRHAEVITAASGEVLYETASDDLVYEGAHLYQWVVVWPSEGEGFEAEVATTPTSTVVIRRR